MPKIAVDVVLLPSDEMMDKAIEINRKLSAFSGNKMVLNKKDCLPHISLAMGVIDEKNLFFVEKDLQEIAKQFSPVSLEAAVSVHTTPTGEKNSWFEIKNIKELQALHEEVMKKFSGYFTYDAAAEALYSSSDADESTLSWINNYPQNSSFEKFSPHITLGVGEISDDGLQMEFTPLERKPHPRLVRKNISNRSGFLTGFTASRLALCHLGNHYTCRKILAIADLIQKMQLDTD